MTNPFVFLVGCSRSGTTLIQRMVDAHPQIAIIPEAGAIVRRFEARQGMTAGGLVTPETASDFFDKPSLFRYLDHGIVQGEVEGLLQSGESIPYSSFISRIFDRYGAIRCKPLVGNKTPRYVQHIPTLHALFQQARFCHIIRDGRDVCLSAMKWRKWESRVGCFASSRDDPVSTTALWWEWNVRLGREAGRSLGPELYREVRYEALVACPEVELAAFCEFLDMPYSEDMLRYYEGRVTNDGGLDAKHAWLPPTPALRDWRTEMPNEDVQRFEAVASELINELGYARGAERIPAQALRHAAWLRSRFEGRPLPEGWQ